MHKTACLFVTGASGDDPFNAFRSIWLQYQDSDRIIFDSGETWDHFYRLGRVFCDLFERQYVERGYAATFTELDGRLFPSGRRIRIDYIGEDRQGRNVVMEFKATGRPIAIEDALPQLCDAAAYAAQSLMASWPIIGVVCNFVKETGIIVWQTIELQEGMG